MNEESRRAGEWSVQRISKYFFHGLPPHPTPNPVVHWAGEVLSSVHHLPECSLHALPWHSGVLSNKGLQTPLHGGTISRLRKLPLLLEFPLSREASCSVQGQGAFSLRCFLLPESCSLSQKVASDCWPAALQIFQTAHVPQS